MHADKGDFSKFSHICILSYKKIQMLKQFLSILIKATDWYCAYCMVDYGCEIPTSAIKNLGVLCDKMHIGVFKFQYI